MTKLFAIGLAAALVGLSPSGGAEELVNGRKSLVLENPAARLVVDLGGGSIGDFHLKGGGLNPLHWATPASGETSIHGFGHFVCLDRWGPPSAAEGAKGMPYHGEAANVEWQIVRDTALQKGVLEAQMSALLPKAGLALRRTIRMSSKSALFTVREEVTNQNPLGRIFNLVQHPTIGPPFLQESTVVDCNGGRGFAQGGSLPNPEAPAFTWPEALDRDGKSVDLRRLAGDPNPNVVSYAIDEGIGWVTAATPSQRLLIGYLWKTADYPWVSLWRDTRDGKPAARGLEFGTTGLHQPFPILVKKGRIWDRALFEYLDAGETTTRSYLSFLLKIPNDFAGVGSIKMEKGRLRIHERKSASPRELTIDTEGLITD